MTVRTDWSLLDCGRTMSHGFIFMGKVAELNADYQLLISKPIFSHKMSLSHTLIVLSHAFHV